MSLDYPFFIELARRWSRKSKCLSIQVGAVLITPDGTQVGAGYNGPPRGIPHCNSEERLEWFLNHKGLPINHKLFPGLTETNFDLSGQGTVVIDGEEIPFFILIGEVKNKLKERWGKECPRKILGCESGEELHLCQAAHAEANALINAAREGIRTKGLILCSSHWGLSCQECSKLIINAGISEVVVTSLKEYDKGAKWLLDYSGVKIIEVQG